MINIQNTFQKIIFSPEKDKLLNIILYEHLHFLFVYKYLCMGHIQ